MLVIRDIAVLVDWKRRMVEKGTFNIEDLTTKADSLERRLDKRLDGLTADLSQPLGQPPLVLGEQRDPEADRMDLNIRKVTHAFANAAKVYLHVLLQGPNPEAKDIARSVRDTLGSFTAFPDPKLLQNAVWPFCIAGCMATKEHRQAFTDLAITAGIHRDIFGTSWKAFEVMETCWRMRDESEADGKHCDWLDAMNRLGHQVLLI